MKYKFKIGDIVKFKTQDNHSEPYSIISKGWLEVSTDKQIVYSLQNSTVRQNQVCEDLLEKLDKNQKKLFKGEVVI